MPGAQLIGVDTQASLDAVLSQAMAEATPDAIIASGDLAHDALPDVYARFLHTVQRHSSAPLLCLPGNHDVLSAMQSARLPMQPSELGAWSVVWLDSHEDDQPSSRIDDADRARVAQALAKAQGDHVLLATHHPLVAVNCPWLDRDRIQNAAELLEWLAECSACDGISRLRSVVFGHAHQIVEDDCGNVPVYGAPSTCFQFKPDIQTFAVDSQSPGYRWLQLDDDGSMQTHIRRVESFPIHVQLNA